MNDLHNLQKSDPTKIRTKNRQLVLRTIYHGQSNTRSDLAKFTGLTRTAISDVVTSLINDGLIIEVGYRLGQAGKPPILLEIPDDARIVIGIKIEVGYIKGVTCDLRGKILDQITITLDSTEISQVLISLRDCLDHLIGSVTGNILGIGISSPGIINTDSGVIIYAANLGWRDVHLKELLEKFYDLPIYISNDTYCAGLSEILFGFATGYRRVCTVIVEAGVGAGMIITGEQCIDVTNGSSEIGQLKVQVDFMNGFENKRDMPIEDLIGQEGLKKRLNMLAKQINNPDLLELSKNRICFKTIKDLALSGNLKISQFIADTGYYLGKAIAVLVNLLHPNVVIINGPICDLGENLIASIWDGISEDALEEYVVELDIYFSALENSVVLGAVALLLRYELGLI